MHFFWVALGGSLGAIARYSVGRLLLPATNFPWATLAVNVAGSFLIGLLSVLLLLRQPTSDDLRLLLMTGFLGAFTTFSSFSLETLTLLQNGAWLKAVLNVLGNVLLCLLAVIAGYTAGRIMA